MTNKLFMTFILLLIFIFTSCSDIEKMRKKKVFQAIQDKNYDYISDSDYYDVKDKYKRTPLMLAIINNDIKMVKLLVKKGAKIEKKDVFGETPLQKATTAGNLEISKFLIENKANINHLNKFAWSILLKAIYSENIDLIKYLIEKNANMYHFMNDNRKNALLLSAGGNESTWMKVGSKYVSLFLMNSKYRIFLEDKDIKDEYGILRFSFRNKLDIMKLLIKSGIDINYADKYGNTALINSIKSENMESIKWLIDNGADVNLLTGVKYDEKTPLIEAAKLGNIDIVKLLFKNKADISICDSSGYSPYIFSIMNKRLLVSKYLKQLPHRCSSKSDIQLASLIIDKKYDILKQLDISRNFTGSEIIGAIKDSIKKRKIKYYKLFIKAFDSEKSNKLLKYILENGSNEAIDIAIKKNLSIDKKDSNIIYDYKLKKITLKELKNKKLPEFVNKKERITPLMLAARWGDKDLIKLLLSKNKNTINKINKKGLSAIFYSVKNGDNEINDYLIKNGASTNTFASKKMNLAMFALKYKANNLAYRLIKDIKSIKNKNDIRSLVYEDEDHWTIMEYASRYGSYRILKHLFQQKVKYPKSIDEDSYSPLMLAVKHSGPKVVEILLKNKAKANEALKYKRALMFAIEKNKYEVAKLLIKHKAGAFIRDYRLWNSLFYAVRYSDVKMFKLILKEIEFDKNPKTGKDDNLFLIASLKKGNVEILKEINKLKIIDVNAKNIIGETALIVAVKNNHIKNIKYLLSIGANPSIKDINGLNAYHFAETRGYKNALIELNKYNITISSK